MLVRSCLPRDARNCRAGENIPFPSRPFSSLVSFHLPEQGRACLILGLHSAAAVILFVGGPPKGREILAKRMGKNGFGSNPVGADKVGLGSLISGWTEFAVSEDGASASQQRSYSYSLREQKARERGVGALD